MTALELGHPPTLCVKGASYRIYTALQHMWSLPHAVCEAPLLLVSMGNIVVSKGTWYYGTTTQAGAPENPAGESAAMHKQKRAVGIDSARFASVASPPPHP